MGRTHLVRARLGVLFVVLATAALFVASAPAAHAITRSAAEAKALRALDVRGSTDAVIVFGQAETVPAGAVIREAGDRVAHTGGKAGLRSIKAPVVMRNGDEAAYLFHEDRGPYQAFQHPSQIALVEKGSGDVRVSRELSWVPMIDGEALPWFASAGSYEKDEFRVFERGVGAIGRSLRSSARAKARKAQADPAQLESRRRVSNALAAEKSCALRASDTLGDFFDYSGIDRSRARLGMLLEQLERMNAGFRSQRYSVASGRTPAAELQRMIVRSGCKDVLLYLAGSGYSGGAPAINVGTAPGGERGVRLQDISATQIERVMAAHRDVTFKVVIDAPYGGRVAERLRDEPNLALFMSAGSASEPSYAFMPNIVAGGQVVRNTLNPTQLLEFTNRLVRGMEAFVDSPFEVDHALGDMAGGRAPSMMVRMLARGLQLGTVGAPALPTTPVVILGGSFQASSRAPLSPPGQTKKNTAPVANDSSATVVEDTPTTVPLPATDADGDPLSWSITDEPDHGALSGAGNARAYTPSENFTGTDSFVYRVTDSTGASDTATVTIGVTAVDDDAEILTSPGTVPYTENGSPVVIDGAVDIADVDTPDLTSATVAITGGHAGTQDRLSFDELLDLSSITGEFDEDSGVLVLSGTATVAEYQAALRTVRYANTSDAPSVAGRTITFAAAGGSDSRALTLTEVNDAPVNGVPEAQTVDEDTMKVFSPGNANALSISDVDARAGAVEVSLDVDHGTLSLGSLSGLTFGSGDGLGDEAMTFTGTVAAVNTALNGLGYVGRSHYDGGDTLTIATDDQGNTGTGGDKTDSDKVAITVAAVNDAPVNTVPAGQSVDEDTPITLTDAFSVADVDAESGTITTTLSAPNSIITVGGSGGTVTDNASSAVQIAGTLAQVNARLASVTYQANTNVNGTRTLTMNTSDGGNTGSGGAKTDNGDTVLFTIAAINDVPVNTVPGAQTVDEDTPKTLTDAFSVADVDAESGTVTTTLSAPNSAITVGGSGGTVTDNGTSAVQIAGTLAQVNARLASVTYRANTNVNGTRTLTMNTSDGGNTGSGGPKTDNGDTVLFTIAAVNDAPVNTVPGTQTVDEDTPLTLTDAFSVADVDAESGTITTTLSAPNSIITVGGSGGTVGDNGTASVQIAGTLSQVNARLASVTYEGASNVNGTRTLTMNTSDGGNTGSGSSTTDNGDTVLFTIAAVNDAPVNTAPAGQSVDEDTSKTLTDAFSVADVDAESGTVTTTLSAPNSTITVGGSGGTVTDNASSAVQIAGTLTQVNARLASVTYQADQHVNGTRTLTMNTSDGGNTGSGSSSTDNGDTVLFTIAAVNDVPVNTVPAGQSVDEDTPKTLTDAFSVADVDAESGTVTTTLAAPNSIITVGGTGGTVNDNGTASVSISGTLSQVNARLASVTYQATTNVNGTRTLTMNTSDSGNTGSGGPKTDNGDTVLFTIAAVNDAPVNTVPAGQSVEEDTPITLTDAFSVADVDAESGTVTTTLSAPNSIITVGGSGGTVADNGTASVQIAGTLSQVNARLASVTYEGASNVNGTRTLTMNTSDGGNTGSGSSSTDNGDTVLFTIAAVNDAPVNGLPAAQSVAEDSTLTFSSGTLNPVSLSDVDAASGTVTTTLSVLHGRVTAALPSSGTRSGNGTASLQLTGTVAAIDTALNSLVYTPTANYSGSETLTVLTSDGGNTGSGGTTTDSDDLPITVTAVNDAPVLTVPGAQSVNEDTDLLFDGAKTISIADDGPSAQRVTLSVGSGTLTLGTTSGLTFSSGANGSGAMTFEGTLAQVNAALAGLTYRDATNASGSRTLSVSVSDLGNTGTGGALTDSETVGITVNAVNDAPSIALNGPTASFTEEGSAVTVDGDIAITDVDDTHIGSARVAVTTNVITTSDRLTFTPAFGITDSSSDPYVLTLAGSATKAEWETVLESVKFRNSETVTPGSDRTVTFKVNDGDTDSNTAAKTVTIVDTPDGPVITPSSGATTYTEDVSSATTVDGALDVARGADSLIDSGTVRISSGFQTGDVFTWTNSALVTGSYSDGTGVLTFTTPGAEAEAAEWETVLQSVRFATTNNTPAASKLVEFTLDDGTRDSNVATKAITVTETNDVPVVTSGGTLGYTENAAATPIHSGLSVGEVEGENITSATALVTSNFRSAEDVIAWTDNNTTTDSITRDMGFVPEVGEGGLRLVGAGTAAQYEAALRAVTYRNSSEAPNAADRTLTFGATDARSGTGNATRTIAVTPVDDLPRAANDSPDAIQEGASATRIDVLANDTDADGGAKSISAKTNGADGTVAITNGGADLTYTPSENFCGTDTFSYTLAPLDTGTPANSTATVSVTVTCVNDAPVADDESFTGENGAIGNTTLEVNDASDPAVGPGVFRARKTITPVNGDLLHGDDDIDDAASELRVTRVFSDAGENVSADGGTLAFEDDGDFLYTSDPADDCANPQDTFNYEVSDPDGAKGYGTVTVDVAGCVWYVHNNASGNVGSSTRPFHYTREAEAESQPGHTVFVYKGDGSSGGYSFDGYQMDSRERLIGEHEALTVDPDGSGPLTSQTLQPARQDAHPTLSVSSSTPGDVISLDDDNEVRGLIVDPYGNGGGIAGGSGDAGGTIDDVKVDDVSFAGNQPGLELNGTTGTFNLTNFVVSNKAHGVMLSNAGTVDFGGDAGQVSLTTSGGPALTATGTSMGSSHIDDITVTGSNNGGVDLDATTGTIALGDGAGTDLNLTTTSGGEPALDLNNSAGVQIDANGDANVRAAGGPAVDVTATAGIHLPLDDVDSSNSATDGINLADLGSGTFSATSGDITGADGLSFDVDGGSGDITYPGAFGNSDSAGAAFRVINRSGGTVTLSGPITDTNDTGGSLLLNNNSGGTTRLSHATTKQFNNTGQFSAVVMSSSPGHTLELTNGGLDIDAVNGRGIDAHTNGGSGTILVTGSTNTVNTAANRAVSIVDTNIAGGDVTFRSVGVSGAGGQADHGVFLQNTGTAGNLAITGNDGGNNQAPGTGGTITNTSNEGVYLENSDGFSADELVITGSDDAGVKGTSVDDFRFTDGRIQDAGDSAGDLQDSAVAFDTSTAGTDLNVEGVVTITGNELLGHRGSGVSIGQETGTIDDLTVSSNTLTSSTAAGDAIRVQLEGTASTVSNLTTATINSNTIRQHQNGDGIIVVAGNTVGTTSGTYGSGSDPIEISANRTNPDAGDTTKVGQMGISATMRGRGTGHVDITNAVLRNITQSAIEIRSQGNADATYRVNNNQTDQNNHVPGDVDHPSISITTDPFGALKSPTMKARVNANTLSNFDSFGVQVRNGDTANHDGRTDLAMTNNVINRPPDRYWGFYIFNGYQSDFVAGADLCMTISANTTAPPNTDGGFRKPGIYMTARNFNTGTSLNGHTGLTPNPADAAQTEAYVTSQNPNSNLGGDPGFWAGKRVYVSDLNTRTACTHPGGMP